MTSQYEFDLKNRKASITVKSRSQSTRFEKMSADQMMQNIIDEVDQEFIDKELEKQRKAEEEKERESISTQERFPLPKDFGYYVILTIAIIYIISSDDPAYAYICVILGCVSFIVLGAFSYWCLGGSFFEALFGWPRGED